MKNNILTYENEQIFQIYKNIDMKNFSLKNVKISHFLYALLVIVILVGCSAETRSEVTMWSDQLIETTTKGELILIIVIGSYIGSCLSK